MQWFRLARNELTHAGVGDQGQRIRVHSSRVESRLVASTVSVCTLLPECRLYALHAESALSFARGTQSLPVGKLALAVCPPFGRARALGIAELVHLRRVTFLEIRRRRMNLSGPIVRLGSAPMNTNGVQANVSGTGLGLPQLGEMSHRLRNTSLRDRGTRPRPFRCLGRLTHPRIVPQPHGILSAR